MPAPVDVSRPAGGSAVNWPTPKIGRLAAAVRPELDGVWDFDESMDPLRAQDLGYGRLLFAIHDHDPGMLDWLTFFVACRGLTVWEGSCHSLRPRLILEEWRGHLALGRDVDWDEATRATPSPHEDCSYTDTQSASDAVAECARYLSGRDPLQAICCVSSVDCAYDHVLTDHRFREWFLDVALAVALEKRDMTKEERKAYRPARWTGEGLT